MDTVGFREASVQEKCSFFSIDQTGGGGGVIPIVERLKCKNFYWKRLASTHLDRDCLMQIRNSSALAVDYIGIRG